VIDGELDNTLDEVCDGDDDDEIEHVPLMNVIAHGVHCVFVGPDTISASTTSKCRWELSPVTQPCM